MAAWLTGLAAFPALLAMGWVFWRLLRAAPPGEGLAGTFCAALGNWAGKGLTLLYIMWGLFLLCLEARLYGERMLAASAKDADLPFLLLILLALVLWMGRKKLAAFARAAEIFYLVLTVTLVLVLAFSVTDLRPENVLPIWTEDIPGVLRATVVPLSMAGVGVFAAFLGGRVAERAGDGRRGVRWLAAGCVAMSALQFGVLAQLGPVLSARLESPFFEVARGVGVAGAFQRVDSVVVALWLLSDLALLGLLLFALRAMATSVFGPRWEKWTPAAAVILAFFGAVVLLPSGFAAESLASAVALPGNLIMGFAVPLLVLLALKVKGARKEAHI